MRSLIALAAVVAAAGYEIPELHLMRDKARDGAVCLDGTPGGFYFRKAQSVADARKWILFFQGGGWCYSPQHCLARSKTQIGSSKTWAPTLEDPGIMSPDCSVNPTFCNYNLVRLQYCDGTSFTGDAEPQQVNGTTIFYRGRRIRDAVLSTLTTNSSYGLSEAEEVLVTGCSAGGLATYIHADAVGDYLRVAAPGMTKFKAAPVSGFFLDAKNVYGTRVYRQQIQNIFTFANPIGGLNRACLRANDGNEWRCMMAQYIYPHIATPIFMLNSAIDSFQTMCILSGTLPPNYRNSSHTAECFNVSTSLKNCFNSPNIDCDSDQVAYLLDYSRTYMGAAQAAATFTESGNGAYIDSCHLHCEAKSDYWAKISDNGVLMRDAVYKWWAAEDEPAADHTYFPCELKQWAGARNDRRCNPTCPKSAQTEIIYD